MSHMQSESFKKNDSPEKYIRAAEFSVGTSGDSPSLYCRVVKINFLRLLIFVLESLDLIRSFSSDLWPLLESEAEPVVKQLITDLLT